MTDNRHSSTVSSTFDLYPDGCVPKVFTIEFFILNPILSDLAIVCRLGL